MTAQSTIVGREHWTHKGFIRLFLWEKAAAATPSPLGTILFVHNFFSQPAPVYRGA